MKVDGACHCGAIAYESEIDPAAVTICHCSDCQTLTGTAYRVSVPTRREGFVLRRGQPQVYVKTAESGNRRIQAFCGACGSPLYAADADDDRSVLGLRVGALSQRRELPPRKQIWCRSALGWTGNLSALPKHEGE